MIDARDIDDAARRLVGVIRPTPALVSAALSDLTGREVLLKPEHFQRTGSFKIRGAYNRISRLAVDSPDAEVVAASAGNHAQGVALAASLSGLRARIYMPKTAALPKVEATRGYGALVILRGSSVDECIELARAEAAASRAIYVPPFDDPLIIAGQGTIGLELAREVPHNSTVVVPVGGGGLIAGIATALARDAPEMRVVGVEEIGSASMAAATIAGQPVLIDERPTIADGIAIRRVSDLTLSHVTALVDELVAVDQEEISRAVLLLLERAKWVVEPAGAAAVAAILAGKVSGDGPVVALVSGGNVDPLLLTRLIEHGLAAAGRYLIIRVVISDRPGALASLTATIAAMELNVLAVDHHRSGTSLAIDEVEVLITVETRDPSHRDAIVDQLVAAGYRSSML